MWAAVAGALALLALAAPSAQALTPATFSYPGAPVPIPDGADLSGNAPGAQVTATVAAAGLGAEIADIDFRIDGTSCNNAVGSTTVGLDHSFVSDLRLTLTSPGGTPVLIMNEPDGSGNNFCQTLLDDESGGSSIQTAASATAPFTGSWLPNAALSAFDGENPNGNWTLGVQDFFAQDIGNIRAFSVIITPKAEPAIAGTSSADITLGGTVSETAVVTGRDTPVADTVDFDLYGPDDATCANPPVFTTAAAAIDGGGNASSGNFTPTAIGTYRWIASYSGDANNVATATACGGAGQTVVVAAVPPPPPPPPPAVVKAVTTITGTSSPNTAQGGVVADTAVVDGRTHVTAGDTATFRLYGPDDATCARAPAFTSPAVPVNSVGVARSPEFRITTPGTYRWIASYGGDANNAASTTPCGQGTHAVNVRAPVVCKSQRTVTVRLIRREGLRRDLRGARIVGATLTPAAGGTAVTQKFTKTVATVDLRGLPKGFYTISVRIRPRVGATFTFKRTYQTCEFPRSVSVGGS